MRISYSFHTGFKWNDRLAVASEAHAPPGSPMPAGRSTDGRQAARRQRAGGGIHLGTPTTGYERSWSLLGRSRRAQCAARVASAETERSRRYGWSLTNQRLVSSGGSPTPARYKGISVNEPTIVVCDTLDAEAVALISDGLDKFNAHVSGIDDRRPLAVLARHADTGQVVGGLIGRTSLGVLFVDLLYLPPSFRGLGLGGEILRRAEEEGSRRGCRAAALYTISFQAPDFTTSMAGRRLARSPANYPVQLACS